jgi:hypothetical protein
VTVGSNTFSAGGFVDPTGLKAVKVVVFEELSFRWIVCFLFFFVTFSTFVSLDFF